MEESIERRVWSAVIAALLVKMLVTCASPKMASFWDIPVRPGTMALPNAINHFFVLVNPSFSDSM
jgi:hypothetical protein